MNLAGCTKRLRPLLQKLKGKASLCPWASIFSSIDPRSLSGYPPPIWIEEAEHAERYKKLRFNGTHEAWFPASAEVTAEMWSEYLAVFWKHPANAHFYLAHGTPVHAGDVCLDCGSCEGFFAYQALEAGAAKVICIEPNPEMADCLTRTFASQIALGRIVVRNVALGGLDGAAAFSANRLNPFGGAVEDSSSTTATVRIETIATVCAQLELDRVDFIKMDIEGAELQAVEGALPILRRDHPRLAITTYHRSFHYAALHVLLRSAGYRQIKPTGTTARESTTFRPVMLHARW